MIRRNDKGYCNLYRFISNGLFKLKSIRKNYKDFNNLFISFLNHLVTLINDLYKL